MNKTGILTAAACLAAALFTASAQAADPAAGQTQYEATCAACHGANGISVAPFYPNLGGQKQEYLVAQLKAFRDGSRKNDIMQPQAQGLSNTQIANLAAYLETAAKLR